MSLPPISSCVSQFDDSITFVVPVWERLITDVQRLLWDGLGCSIKDGASESLVHLLGGDVVVLALLLVLELA